MSGDLQRYTRDARCPICGHHANDPAGDCHGILTDGGAWARCTRADCGDAAMLDEECEPPAYVYRRQDDGAYRPWTKEPPTQPIRTAKPRTAAYSAPQGATKKAASKTHPRPPGSRTYTYSDTEGVEAVRRVAGGKKDCYPRVRDHADAPWRDGKGIVPRERIYRRDDLAAHPDERMYIVEGEGCADALHTVGVLAITWRGGCGQLAKSLPQIVEAVRGRNVTLVPDADSTGRSAMTNIAMALRGVAASVRIVNLYDDESGRDIDDWLHEGGTAERLLAVADAAPAYEPDTATRDAWMPKITYLSDVQPERVQWLWHDYIPLGKLTVIDGDPGLGKSTLTLDLAARLSTGRPMPDGTRSDVCGPAGVVLLSAEDGLADTIRPRLNAANADVTRIVAIESLTQGEKERGVTLADLPAIEAAITQVDAQLAIIDPVMAYLDNGTNSYRDQDMRVILAPLARLAERYHVAIVVIRHLTKGQNANVLYRGGGTIGIIGAVRAALMVGNDPDGPEGPRRILAVAKSNLARIPPAMAYHMEEAENGTARIVWEGTTHHTAAAITATLQADDGELSALAEATGILRTILADGPMPARVAASEMESAGVRPMTIRRAREALGIVPRREGGIGSAGTWMWELPESSTAAQEPPKMFNESLRCSSTTDEHLRDSLNILGAGATAPPPTSRRITDSDLPHLFPGGSGGNG